jgi:hypothetical protein
VNVDDYRPPSPEIQLSLLQQVQRIIREEIPHSQKGVYEQAMQMDASYVNDDRFVLKFLRADGWDPKQAAVRLVKHFTLKLELFPLDFLCRDITQDDLDPKTLDFLHNSETMRDVPLRDMAGRIITFLIPGERYDGMTKVSDSARGGTASVRNRPLINRRMMQFRRAFYTTMVKAEDMETQLKGRVSVLWLGNTSSGLDVASLWKGALQLTGLPMKQRAIHVCVPDTQSISAYTSFLAVLGFILARLDLVRLKCHFGEYLVSIMPLRHLWTWLT